MMIVAMASCKILKSEIEFRKYLLTKICRQVKLVGLAYVGVRFNAYPASEQVDLSDFTIFESNQAPC